MSNEPFMQEVKFVNNLKIRGSWGRLGNNRIDDYSSQSLYKQILYSFGGNIAQGAAPKENVNPLIQWESSTIIDGGFDALLFGNRLSVEAAYFYKKTYDILLKIPIPMVNGGFSDPYQNAGIVSNRGTEISISWKDKITQDWSYTISGNYTAIQSKVDKFRGDVASYSGNKILKEGLSLNPYFVREVVGIATAETIAQMKTDGYTFIPAIKPGDLLFKDQQKEGEPGYKVIDDNDRVVKGSSLPKYFYGLSLGISYRNFDLNTLLQAVGGINTYIENSWYTTNLTNGVLVNKMALDAWSETNPNTNVPRLTSSSNENTVANEFWLKDASFLRVKSISFGYSLPNKISEKITISRMRFFVSGENLFTFTKFPGFDPEMPSASYPMMKQFIFGLNVNF
jgi:outer membrane receptor protein involved in Fe transport